VPIQPFESVKDCPAERFPVHIWKFRHAKTPQRRGPLFTKLNELYL
jgi:hypothetical protein